MVNSPTDDGDEIVEEDEDFGDLALAFIFAGIAQIPVFLAIPGLENFLATEPMPIYGVVGVIALYLLGFVVTVLAAFWSGEHHGAAIATDEIQNAIKEGEIQ